MKQIHCTPLCLLVPGCHNHEISYNKAKHTTALHSRQQATQLLDTLCKLVCSRPPVVLQYRQTSRSDHRLPITDVQKLLLSCTSTTCGCGERRPRSCHHFQAHLLAGTCCPPAASESPQTAVIPLHYGFPFQQQTASKQAMSS